MLYIRIFTLLIFNIELMLNVNCDTIDTIDESKIKQDKNISLNSKFSSNETGKHSFGASL